MIEYKLVPFHTVGKLLAENVQNHFENMLEEKLQASPKIDWESFLQLSHSGQCVTAIILDNNDIKGYSVFVIGSNPLYKDVIEAENQAIFIEPEYRLHVMRFLRETNTLIKGMGVHTINYTLGNKRLAKLMARAGFDDKYTVWSTDL